MVNRTSDGSTLEIGVLAPGGFADSAAQDAFCKSSTCTISRLFDQSPRGNHLDTAPGGPFYAHSPDAGVNASRSKLSVGGHPVYAAYFEGKMGYRNDATSGVAVGDEPESIYMVTAADHFNDKCCFDFGNAETNVRDDGAGTMETVYFGTSSGGLFPIHKGAGDGPWVMTDVENGLWAGNDEITVTNEPFPSDTVFITAIVKGRPGEYALKGGDAQSGPLKTLFQGARGWRYRTMKKQGAIILGIGGDNSNAGVGTFLEGVMTAGWSSDATDEAVHANIIAAGYGA